MSISINRALSELKLVTKKIEQNQEGLVVAGAFRLDTPETEVTEFVELANAKIDKIKGLIQRRNKLKQAIVMSNAKTTVIVAGEDMMVAEAIERKSSIELEKSFCRNMREKYFGQKNAAENHNKKTDQDADKHAAQALSANTEGDKGAAYTTIVDAYVKKNGAKLVAPKGIERAIEAMQEKIDEFESDVDFILSESNIKTMIDV